MTALPTISRTLPLPVWQVDARSKKSQLDSAGKGRPVSRAVWACPRDGGEAPRSRDRGPRVARLLAFPKLTGSLLGFASMFLGSHSAICSRKNCAEAGRLVGGAAWGFMIGTPPAHL